MSARRADLLSLTSDDLATLANRGLVKRARKDIESGDGPTELAVDTNGGIRAVWPDGSVVTLAPGEVLGDGCCSCAAFTICRHIIGTVFAYQIRAENDSTEDAQARRLLDSQPWDPGAIPDRALETYWTHAQLASIRAAWTAGVVAELHRSHRPLARLDSSGVTLRFLVPGDVRYVQCDCASESPCRHVPLAVWSFRELPAGESSGIVAANQPALKAPVEFCDECERLVESLFAYGAAELPPNDIRRWEGLAARLRRAGLIWPEQVALEWLTLRQQYLEHDARFDAADLVQRSGELLIRMRAICSGTGSVPQLFLRGAREKTSEIGAMRLTGLGAMVSVERKSVRVQTMLQDLASGAISCLSQETAGHERSFHSLGQAHCVKKISLAAAGSGQVLVKGAKRSLNGELSLARSAVALYPQGYEWEKLRAPVLVEDIEELAAHLASLPPPALRPRLLGRTFHVVPTERVAEPYIDPISRRLLARVIDLRGEEMILEFPYYSHGRPGFAKLFQVLTTQRVRFVAGAARNGPMGLAITPAAMVVEESPSVRTMIQPWIDSSQTVLPAPEALEQDAATEVEALALFRLEAINALGEAALTGIANTDPLMERRWAALVEQGREMGLERFLSPGMELHAEVLKRRGSLAWDPSAAVEAAVRQAVLAVFSDSF